MINQSLDLVYHQASSTPLSPSPSLPPYHPHHHHQHHYIRSTINTANTIIATRSPPLCTHKRVDGTNTVYNWNFAFAETRVSSPSQNEATCEPLFNFSFNLNIAFSTNFPRNLVIIMLTTWRVICKPHCDNAVQFPMYESVRDWKHFFKLTLQRKILEQTLGGHLFPRCLHNDYPYFVFCFQQEKNCQLCPYQTWIISGTYLSIYCIFIYNFFWGKNSHALMRLGFLIGASKSVSI